MRIFYHCYGSAHTSVIASAIHVGILPMSRRPDPEEIRRVPNFDKFKNSEIGTPIYIGPDEDGNQVYIIGLATGKKIMAGALLDFLLSGGVREGDVYFADALPGANVLTRIGGFLSRQVGLVRIGRPLCAKGIWQTYPQFVELVRRVKADVRTRPAEPTGPHSVH